MSNTDIDESKKAAIAIKAARTAAGLTQMEFAKMISISKATLARVETLEIPIKLEAYFNAVRELKKLGIVIDAVSEEDIVIRITKNGQERVVDLWNDTTKRRMDKK